jgi:hypothetical protein
VGVVAAGGRNASTIVMGHNPRLDISQ